LDTSGPGDLAVQEEKIQHKAHRHTRAEAVGCEAVRVLARTIGTSNNQQPKSPTAEQPEYGRSEN
jgi:hypothetical protein